MWKKLFEPVDMTQGDPVRQIVKFMIPMLIGNVFQQLYNTVDSIVVGKYIGDNALAAVGSAGPILNLLLVLFMGISVGAGIMVCNMFFKSAFPAILQSPINCGAFAMLAGLVIVPLVSLFTPKPDKKLVEFAFSGYDKKVIVSARDSLGDSEPVNER